MSDHLCCKCAKHTDTQCCYDGHIEMLIERGSLGTPEAQALRATVTQEQVDRVLAIAKRLEHEST
jgi:hypothetical protein